MELYFNPYPGAAKSIEEGIAATIGVVDAFIRLKSEYSPLNKKFADDNANLPPSSFVLVREAGVGYGIKDFIYRVDGKKKDKLRLLLAEFSRGQVIEPDDLNEVEDWELENIGASAPILEIAAKKNAMAFTIPTEPEWQVDILSFVGHDKKLHNLWGQADISALKAHCVELLINAKERFCAKYNASFCKGALNNAPDSILWDDCGFFIKMDRAQERNFAIDGVVLKNVEDTKYGHLLELRGEGHRIFFVYRKDKNPKILVGGFYKKRGGDHNRENIAQNKAIENAKYLINAYEEEKYGHDPRQKTHRSRPSPGSHQRRGRPGKIHPARTPVYATPVVGAASFGGGAGGDLGVPGR
ncbi:MAG: hypothetical protein MdMp014T_0495 [Treponematales bacterium]